MTKQVQRRRGTAAQHSSFTGAEGEISVNTTNKSVHVHDGLTAGGIEAARADLANVSDADLNTALSGNTLASLTITSADINGGTIDGTVIGGSTPAAISGTTITGTSFVSSGDMTFGDNDKAIFGAGSDLQIYHNGSASIVKDDGTGDLYLGGDNNVLITNAALNETKAKFISNGAVELYYDNAVKLATTATGVDVTGDIGADTATISGNLTVDTNTLFVDASNNRVGVGTSSPESALHIASASGNAQLRVITGDTTSVSQLIFGDSADSNTGGLQYNHSDDSLQFHVGNIGEKMRLDSSGNVGIGTVPDTDWYTGVTALQLDDAGSLSQNGGPGGRLVLALNAKQTGSSYITGWDYQQTDEASGYVQIGGEHFWWSAASGTADTAITWSERMRIDSSGNVGIGTSSIAANTRLAVVGPRVGNDVGNSTQLLMNTATTISDRLTINFSMNGVANRARAGIGAVSLDASGYNCGLAFYTRSAADGSGLDIADERMRITSTGSVGIGTSSPGYKLTVAGYSNVASANKLAIGDNADYQGLIHMESANETLTIENTSDYAGRATIFKDNGTERMRIDASGKLLVNTTSGVGGNASSGRIHAIHVQHGASFQTTAASGFAAATFSRNSNNGAVCEFFYDVNSAAIGRIDVTSTATSYVTSSDYRLKEDVQPMVGSVDRLMALKPVNFAWKVDGSRVDGFLAHEAQEVVPQAVTGEKDGEQMQAIDHSKLVPLLTAALQEALTKIEALEVRLNALEGQ